MMRKFGRTDLNHSLIIKELRRLGFSVESLAGLGQGRPDLLVGWGGFNWLFELKSSASATLTEEEVKWHLLWRGQVMVVTSISELLKVLEDWAFWLTDKPTQQQLWSFLDVCRKRMK